MVVEHVLIKSSSNKLSEILRLVNVWFSYSPINRYSKDDGCILHSDKSK